MNDRLFSVRAIVLMVLAAALAIAGLTATAVANAQETTDDTIHQQLGGPVVETHSTALP